MGFAVCSIDVTQQALVLLRFHEGKSKSNAFAEFAIDVKSESNGFTAFSIHVNQKALVNVLSTDVNQACVLLSVP